MEKCNRCGKTDDKPKLADQGGTWVHHNCYIKWQDRQDQAYAQVYRPLFDTHDEPHNR